MRRDRRHVRQGRGGQGGGREELTTDIVKIRGRSMVPTLRPGQRVLCSPLRRPRRGDLVWVRRPDGSGLVKRLVGLPGEQVELVGARVRIDGRLLEEPYLEPRSDLQPLADAAWTLGPDAFVVLGDARDDSLDSRRFGPVKRAELAGRAALRLWPPAIL